MSIKQAAVRRQLPTDDADMWWFQEPHNVRVGWTLDESGMSNRIWTERCVRHAGGRRAVSAHIELSKLLDSLAATKVGRKALLDALVRHES